MTHGTATGYAKHGCRCVACTRAQRERMREYRKQRTAESLSGATDSLGATTQSDPATAPTVRGHGTQEVES